MKNTFLLLIILFILIAIGCTENDTPTEPANNDEAEKIYNDIVLPQEANYGLLTNMLTEIDTLSALDSVLSIFMKDTLVEQGEITAQGIWIKYRSGVIGGLLIDPKDGPDSLGIQLNKNFESYSSNINKNIVPSSKRTTFINPIYSDRKTWSDLMIGNYNDRFPTAGYQKPEIYNNSAATVAKFANLSDYGIIHISSHGFAAPNEDNIVEVYLMTGEAYNETTSKEYDEGITRGRIPIITDAGKTHFWISG